MAILIAAGMTGTLACSLPIQEGDQDPARAGTTAEPTKREARTTPVATISTTGGVQPNWVAFFSDDPRVQEYRWYQGEDCPTGDYSQRDDLYIFGSEDALSPLEVQARDLDDKLSARRDSTARLATSA